MVIRRSNRFYLFIAGYTFIFTLLASMGYLEIREALKEQQEKVANESFPVLTAGKSLYHLPRMELTLSSFQGQAHHARIGLNLEVDKNDLDRFEDFQPRVSDRIIDFLRHQDIDEIQKPSAMPNLRRTLLEQINQASAPIPVTDIVFREFVVR